MSSNVNKPVAVAVSAVLLGGMALSTSAFAMNDLAAGYLLGATAGDKAAEGKCGEGKCGTAAIDTNKDGKVSKDEFTAHMGKPGDYARYDTNKDGYIDNAEMKAAHEGKCGEGRCGSKGGHTMQGMDTDKDGKVSKTEFAAAHGGDDSRFAKYDGNTDGVIDAAELKAAHEGKCGEGKCGADKKKHGEGKCGEGKCGGAA